jgi:hypothetical protein
MSETREIPLSRGKVAIVDAADFDFLNQWKWSALRTTKAGNEWFYAVRVQVIDSKQRMFLMHRVLTDAPKGMLVDHHDRNTLNNTRKNLRVCTTQENSLNTKGWDAKKRKSRFKGLWWSKPNKVWVAEFRGRNIGSFTNEEEAARAYDRAALDFSPEFSRLNFPKEVRSVESAKGNWPRI